MTAVLELREVSKAYETGAAEVHALRQVSLSVDGGELVAVMGPSGSGKSTLLTIAGSLEEPTSGQVLVAGNDLSDLSANDQAKLRRRLIGYVFQDFNLLAGLTAVENVTLPLELDGTGVKAARPAGMKALQELGVAERADRFPDELSGGERQRVAIARAVVVNHPAHPDRRHRRRTGPARYATRIRRCLPRPGRRTPQRPRHPQPRAHPLPRRHDPRRSGRRRPHRLAPRRAPATIHLPAGARVTSGPIRVTCPFWAGRRSRHIGPQDSCDRNRTRSG